MMYYIDSIHSSSIQKLSFYLIYHSSVRRLRPFLGFIYDLLDFFGVDRIVGFSDICVDMRKIFGRFLQIFSDFWLGVR